VRIIRCKRTATASVAVLALVGLAGCRALRGEPPTPTLSSDDVLQTAEAIAEQTRQATTPTATRTPVPPSPTVPLETPTSAFTPTPSTAAVTANYNANVRTGPGEGYPVIDFLLQGEAADVVGRFDNPQTGRWWSIRRRGRGLDRWIWGGAVTFSGAEAAVPFLPAPPTPTKAPDPTATPTVTPTVTETPGP
jgi:hypothetical protein